LLKQIVHTGIIALSCDLLKKIVHTDIIKYSEWCHTYSQISIIWSFSSHTACTKFDLGTRQFDICHSGSGYLAGGRMFNSVLWHPVPGLWRQWMALCPAEHLAKCSKCFNLLL